MELGAAMKIAKYVVIAQMVLSAVLVVIFVTRSNASNRPRAKADDHHGAQTAEPAPGETHGEKAAKNDKADKADKADKLEKAEKAEKAEPGHGEDDGETDSDEGASKKHPGKAGRLALNEASEGGDLKLDIKSEGHDKPAKGRERDAKGREASPAGFGTDPKIVAQNLLAGNARFVEGHRSGFDMVEQRETSAGAQHPGVMVLGCADSRVPPELIFDRGVGEMFVVRSAGNIAEPVAVGSLEYAAEHLHTKVLLILGHEKCGAVQAALSDAKMPSVNLDAMVEAISPAVKELKAWVDGDQLVHMAVEANVRRQADEVMRRSPLLRQAVARKELIVLKAVYDLQTGHVRPL